MSASIPSFLDCLSSVGLYFSSLKRDSIARFIIMSGYSDDNVVRLVVLLQMVSGAHIRFRALVATETRISLEAVVYACLYPL